MCEARDLRELLHLFGTVTLVGLLELLEDPTRTVRRVLKCIYIPLLPLDGRCHQLEELIYLPRILAKDVLSP